MAAPIITPIPTPPIRSDAPADFAAKADAFAASLPQFVTETNASAAFVDQRAIDADASAQAAAASEAAAEADRAEVAANTATVASNTATVVARAGEVAANTLQVAANTQQVAADAQAVADALASVADGPVTSVNGKTGVVTLTSEDVLPPFAGNSRRALVVNNDATGVEWGGDWQEVGDVLLTARTPEAGYLPATGDIYMQSAYPELFEEVGLIGGLVGSNFAWSGATGLPAGYATTALATDGNGVWVAGCGDISPSTRPKRSVDNGVTWADVSGPTVMRAQEIATDGAGTWVAVRYQNTIYRSTDNGATWAAVTLSAYSEYLEGLAYGNGVWVACGQNGRVFRSVDGGATWAMSVVVSGSTYHQGVATDGAGTWICVSNSSIAVSYDNAATWVVRTVSGNWLSAGWAAGCFVVAGGAGAMVRSTDHGVTWQSVAPGLGTATINAVSLRGEWAVAGASNGTAAISRNGGESWVALSLSPTSFSAIHGCCIAPDYTLIISGVSDKVARSLLTYPYDTGTQFRLPTVVSPDGVTAYIKAQEVV